MPQFFFVIRRSHVFGNELYVKLLSEKNCFVLLKHKANREIIKEYKRIEDKSFVRYVVDGADYLLYKNETDVLRMIQTKDGKLENILYEPKFYYEIDGKYVHFIFEDERLDYVDGIMMRLMTNTKQDEKNLYYIPVNTNASNFDSIIRIDKLEELNLQDVFFKVEYACCY